METTLVTPTAPVKAPRPVSVMGAGEEILALDDLKTFHTPSPSDRGERNYHEHDNLTSHHEFAQAVIHGCAINGIHINNIAFKVDKVQQVKVPLLVNGIRLMGHKQVRVANRFFLIASISNPELQVANDVETFIVARNSHDKVTAMELAIGNRVIVCSNMMFGGDIHIKSKNSRFGFDHFHDRMQDLFLEYNTSVGQIKNDIKLFKSSTITEAQGHQFIGHNSTGAEFIQPGRTHKVHEMWMRPEHREYYQNISGPEYTGDTAYASTTENWTLWRLLNAYTYVHRGDIAIDKDTNEPYAEGHPKFETRTNQTALKLKKEYTAKLWAKLTSLNGDINPFL